MMIESRQYYFISGLPRSGSTLLSALLLQNPDFYADIASPLQGLLLSTIDHLSGSENSKNISDQKRETILKGLIDNYYCDQKDKKVIFDSSRAWTAETSLVKQLYPYTKIICCVRDIVSILNSFEKLKNKNAYWSKSLYDDESVHCVHTRSNCLMDAKKSGVVYKPWHWLDEGLKANPDLILLVEYDDLTKKPEKTMKRIYNFIGFPYYENHNFNEVEYSNPNFDYSINSPDLHTVKKRVEFENQRCLLPDSIVAKYTNWEFWRPKKKAKDFDYA